MIKWMMISFILYRRNYLDVNMIIADIFWAAICKSKKAQDRKLCASPFDFLHIANFTWFQLFPFCTEQSIHTVLLSHIQLCSHCGRIMQIVWAHCGHTVEGTKRVFLLSLADIWRRLRWEIGAAGEMGSTAQYEFVHTTCTSMRTSKQTSTITI